MGRFFQLSSLWLALGAVQAGAVRAQTIGSVSFPNSGAAVAQPAFLHGLALLHSFEYEDAAAAFREAQRLDPGFAMAYWGEAMTLNHPVWMEQDRAAAREVLDRLAPSPAGRTAKAGTDRERQWLATLDVLYGEGAKESRDTAYADAMRRLHAAYPDDHEAAAFHALALLGTAHGGRDFATYMRAAALVEPVFLANPHHPGAAHYLIHSFDDPIHAPLGLSAARAYARIAPDAGHAQHMTSHIFVALGMWDDVVAANETAIAVQQAAQRRRGQAPTVCGHYPSWLSYGYLMKGRTDAAARVLDTCRVAARTGPPGVRAAWTSMWTRWVLDTERWHDAGAIDLEPDEQVAGASVAQRPSSLNVDFLIGFAAARTGRADVAATSAARVSKAWAEIESRPRQPGDEAMRRRAQILDMELRALVLLGDSNVAGAIALLNEASAIEEAMPFEFGPPFVDKPSHELLGEVLLEAGRAAEATAAFEAALRRAPLRANALEGLAAAAAAAGNAAKAKDATAALAAIRR
jgi:tetratricopeptide (TPR) repeat protein